MLRLRRYRVFIIFAIVALGLFYHFKGIGYAQNSIVSSVSSLKQLNEHKKPSDRTEAKPSSGKPNERFDGPHGAIQTSNARPRIQTSSSVATVTLKSVSGAEKQAYISDQVSQKNGASEPSQSSGINGLGLERILTSSPTVSTSLGMAIPTNSKGSSIGHHNQIVIASLATGTRKTDDARKSGQIPLPMIHWSQMSENFPVPTESLISVPTGKAARMPKIQHDFGSTLGANKSIDQAKLSAIKKSFEFSWTGYREKAWKQDELSPKSGGSRNTFCGWGATLVDSLDTLWLMDMTDDFEVALDAVKEIDFTTATRNDIPLFETVIRFLGGLIGAYDISGGKYEVLLQKAVELAEILMGAFDTPNRMPMTFYLWKPAFASQPHRAKTRVVMAELGSLSLEFTRLAQITKQAKYYDAIARITNEFALWQNHTKLPGLWPLKVDASGCRKPQPKSHDPERKVNGEHSTSESDSLKKASVEELATDRQLQTSKTSSKSPVQTARGDASIAATIKEPGFIDAAPYSPNRSISKRGVVAEAKTSKAADDSAAKCEAQGLASPPYSTIEEFSLGGLADSTYEYLPKQYLLLDGLEPKYRSMYESAADAAKEYLIYRPMIPDENRSILLAGLFKTAGKDGPDVQSPFQAEGTHLTCFAGGMFALGAKLFERKMDMDIASKLTDGCVWAYEATRTGIMPEIFFTIPCNNIDKCPWNETTWREASGAAGGYRDIVKSDHAQQFVLKEAEMGSHAPSGGDAHKSVVSLSRETATATNVAVSESVPLQSSLPKHSYDELVSSGISQAKTSSMPEMRSNVDDLPLSGRESQASRSNFAPSSRQSSSIDQRLRKRQLGDIETSRKSLESKADQEGSSPEDSQAISFEDDEVANVTVATVRGSATFGDKMDHQETVATRVGESDSETFSTGGSTVLEPTKTSSGSHENDAIKVSMPKVATSGPGRPKDPALSVEKTSLMADSKHELPLGITKIVSSRYLLRPEAIESVFIMYRLTGDVYWRERGWTMFEAIEKHTKSMFGASAILDVNQQDSEQLDEMESFWLAETLKYFYLLFSDPDTLSLDDYVLNTEAHPLKRPKKG